MKINTLPLAISLVLLTIITVAGCSGSSEPILPKGELTPEQIEKVKQEDRKIEDEESGGTVKR
jgi:hypothetical protein